MTDLFSYGLPITSIKQLNEELSNSLENVLYILYFYTKWSQECEALESTIKHVIFSKEKSPSRLFLIECNASNVDIINQYNVKLVPTTVLMKNGKMVSNTQGFNPEEILKNFETFSNVLTEQLITNNTQQSTNNDISLDEKIQQLINSDDIMVFMKGSKTDPYCKFSKKMSALINQYTTKYSTFDVLTDMDIRERIKIVSRWPSFPQLYIKGELIGGSDIVAQMDEQGELKSLLSQVTDSYSKNGDERLKELINQAPIMLFMKGTPDRPFCGFSKSVVSFLKSYGVNFDYFDILSDEKVRFDLKVYSDWPTYPQLYVRGELLGGYDIVKELHESGELRNYL